MSKQAIIITVIIVYIIVRSLIIEPSSIKITTYEIECNELNGLKAAFLSDFHLKKNDYKRLDRIVKLTNKEKPDVVFLGGDFAKYRDKSNKNMNMNIAAQKLNLLDAPKYAVLGDDDYNNGVASAFGSNKIMILKNSAVRSKLKGGRYFLDVIGLNDISTKDVNILKAMKRTRLPRVVLTHNPDVYYDVMDDVTLILAGHTHGGQIVIPMTTPMFVPSKYGAQFASGLKTPRDNRIIISRGLGTDKFPGRFNCEPEIVIIKFIKYASKRK